MKPGAKQLPMELPVVMEQHCFQPWSFDPDETRLGCRLCGQTLFTENHRIKREAKA